MPANHEPRCTGCGLRTSEVYEHTRCAECERVVCGDCERVVEGRALCLGCSLARKAAVCGGRRSGTTGVHSRAASVAPPLFIVALLLVGCASPPSTFKACGDICTQGGQQVVAAWDESRCTCAARGE